MKNSTVIQCLALLEDDITKLVINPLQTVSVHSNLCVVDWVFVKVGRLKLFREMFK